jgi:hypothetical protein
MHTNLRGNDPGRWGHSLANLTEILVPLLDAAGARSVVEIGSYEGDLTRELLEWADGAGGARVTAIEPMPQPKLVELADRYPALELIRETSHRALCHIDLPDAVIVDGDHNYYTVSEELRLIGERARGAELPLLLFHDVGWPHGRRDLFFEPEEVPVEYRESIARGGYLFPGEAGLASGGLPFPRVARREGGPRNGVLTAVEDFASAHEETRLAIVPVFFGLGVLWREDAAWASAVAEIVEPWDRNPILARVEANRVFQLANEHVRREERDRLRERNEKQERLLREMLESRPFSLADRLSGLRRRGRAPSWRQQVRDALGEKRPR